ncbi:hypothetical protein UPYG_G00026750 [Umbra pygmaea]|uniref:Fcf2 pre-rRNA processing C-terminal domain-containing protein n=1 Tax=Umbra pygmaea TaxID=75934 RepID=A0ABD0XM10_UMBPY
MVATRSGVSVGSPIKTNPEISAGVLATPASTRRTRRTAAQFEGTSDFQQDVSLQAMCSTGKRETRTSKRQTSSANQPDSTHEADVSDLDSCCSAVSDTEAVPSTQPACSGLKRAIDRKHPDMEENATHEKGSSFSPVSATQEPSTCRSTRRNNDVSDSSNSVLCSIKVTDLPSRLTRSTRRTAVASSRASSQSHTDAELSDPEPCSSGVQSSTIRRSTRAQKGRLVEAIPMHLEETSDCSNSPVRRSGKVPPSDLKSSDSEGIESGPCMTPRRSCRWTEPKQPVTKAPIGSPRSVTGMGTTCSSRTGSNNNYQGTPPTRMTAKALDTLVEKDLHQSASVTVSSVAETSVDSNSKNVDTIITADPDCSAIEDVCEEDRTLTLDSQDVLIAEPEPSQEAAPSSAVITQDFSGTASEAEDQQRAPSAKEAAEASAVSEQQMTTADSHILLNQPATVTACEHAMSPLGKVSDEEETSMDVDHASTSEELSETIIQKSSFIFHLESSEDGICGNVEKEGGKTEKKGLDGEQVAVCEEDQAGPSRLKAATPTHPATADDCLFFIDNKPGLLSGEPYYMDRHRDVEAFEDKSDDEICNNSEEGGKRERKGLDGQREIVSEEDEAGPSRPQAATAAHPAAAEHGLFLSKDTQPGLPPGKMDKHRVMEVFEDKNEEELFDEEDSDNDEDGELLFKSRNPQLKELSSRIDPGLSLKELGGLYINFDGSKSKTVSNSLKKLKEQKSQDELMKNTVIGPEFEKKDAVPPYKVSKHAAKLKRKEEREKTTGSGWFDMKAPEMTEELMADLKALKMRGAMDPKRFYKKSDRDGFPKYFQLATVVDNPVDFYHSRVPKKQRKRTIVEELLADAEFRQNNKKQYKKVMAEKAAVCAGKQKKRSKMKT